MNRNNRSPGSVWMLAAMSLFTFNAVALLQYRSWDGGAANGLWSDPVNWTNNTKPASNDYAVLGNDCPDVPQSITLDESVWLERLVCVGTTNRHFTISPAGSEVIRINNDNGIYHNRNSVTRTADVTINADIEERAALLKIFSTGRTTINGRIRPCLLAGRTSTYIEPHYDKGLILRGSNTMAQIMAADSARVIFDNYYALGTGTYRNNSGTDGALLLRTNAYVGGFFSLDQPLKLGIEDAGDRDVELKLMLRTVDYALVQPAPVTVLPRGTGCTGHFTIRLLGASANSTTGANSLEWKLDENCTLVLASAGAMFWGRSDIIGTAGWIVGAGRVVCESAGGVSLYSTNAYTGGTWIRSGTMKMMGNSRLPTNGLVTVESAGTLDGNAFTQVVAGLGGNGTVKFSTTTTPGALTLTQSLTPGLSAGKLTLTGPGALTLGDGLSATFELNGLAGTNDQVVISHASGNLNLAGTLKIVNLGGMESGDYKLFDLNGGAVSGSFDEVVLPRTIAGTVDIAGGDVVLHAIKQRGTALMIR